jgi:hypothetical protein
LFFTDEVYKSGKIICFSSCGGNGAIAFVGFITKTAGTIDSNACQGIPTKIRY